MKKRILLVDDEKDFAETVAFQLEELGYDIIVAGDGEEGLDKARQEKPDLIILDLMLPKINGFDVCRKLKTDKKYSDIPIIMLTAKFQPVDIKFGKAMGADFYITKPFEHDILAKKIHELLEGHIT